MDKVLATLRTIGVLLGIWLVLALVGFGLGAIPSASAPRAVVARDAGPPARDTGPPPVDAGPAEVPPIAITRLRIGSGEPSIAAGQLFGDPHAELVVGAGDGWHVIAIGASPARIAMFQAPPTPPEQRSNCGPAAFGDVDGDGHGDVVLPFSRSSTEGATRGGALWWVAADSFGGMRDPIALAPIAATSATIAPFDAEAGAEVAAMNSANALAQLPSEAWIFRGGSAPTRVSTLQTGLAGTEVRIGDLDRDGRPDVATIARDRVDLFFGDENLGFTRRHSMQFVGATEIAIADLDGDGGDDLVVLGGGLHWIRGGEVGQMEPRAIEGAPEHLRSIALMDIDSDGRRDIVGWDHPRLIALAQHEPLHFTRVELTEITGTFGPRRHLVLDADGDGLNDDLALLGGVAADEIALVLVPDALVNQRISADEAADVADAPLMLRAVLP